MVIELTIENNSLICPDHKDGEVQAVFSKIGQHKAILVKPQKFLYINDEKTPCRRKPFHEELLTLLQKDVSKNPGKQCKFPFICQPWLLREKINKLPVCINETRTKYMRETDKKERSDDKSWH